MSTLADRTARNACLDRLARLDVSAQRRWGKMTAHQMVCHLNDSFDAGAGKRDASSATGLLQKTVLKWVALHTPMPWPHNVGTRPEIEQGRGGTPPVDWETDRSALSRRIVEFTELRTFAMHPIFGPMSRPDWLIWGYRHVDHHLRQFGA